MFFALRYDHDMCSHGPIHKLYVIPRSVGITRCFPLVDVFHDMWSTTRCTPRHVLDVYHIMCFTVRVRITMCFSALHLSRYMFYATIPCTVCISRPITHKDAFPRSILIKICFKARYTLRVSRLDTHQNMRFNFQYAPRHVFLGSIYLFHSMIRSTVCVSLFDTVSRYVF